MRVPVGLMSLLVMSLLAGCGGEGTDPLALPTSDPATATPTAPTDASTPPLVIRPDNASVQPEPALVLGACENSGGVFPLPMETAKASLPDGFEPVPSPADPAGGATLYVIRLACESSSLDGNDTGPVILVYAELAVVPPTEWQLPGIDDYTVPLVFGADVEDIAKRLVDWHLGLAGHAVEGTGAHGPLGPQAFVFETPNGGQIVLSGTFSPEFGGPVEDAAFALVAVQDGVVHGLVRGASMAGTYFDGAATMASTGIPAIDGARGAAIGFHVVGFGLAFTPQPGLA